MTHSNEEAVPLTVPESKHAAILKAALRASTCLTAIAREMSGLPCTEPIPEYCEVFGFQHESDGDITFTARIDLMDTFDTSKIVTDFEPSP